MNESILAVRTGRWLTALVVLSAVIAAPVLATTRSAFENRSRYRVGPAIEGANSSEVDEATDSKEPRWTIESLGECAASIEPLDNEVQSQIVRYASYFPGPDWQVQCRVTLPRLASARPIPLSLTIRSDARRRVTLRVLDRRTGNPLADQREVDVTPNAETVQVDVSPATDAADSMLILDVGSSATPLVISNLHWGEER